MLEMNFTHVYLYTRSVYHTTKIFEWMGYSIRDSFPADYFLDYLLEYPEEVAMIKKRTQHAGEMNVEQLKTAYIVARGNELKKQSKGSKRNLDDLLDNPDNLDDKNFDHYLD